MLTKNQKIEKIDESKKLLQQSQSLVFVDFGGAKVKDLEKLRRGLAEFGAKLKVIKKKLLRIALKDKQIDFNPEQFEFQAGAVFSPKEILEIAGPVYKSGIKILGGYDLSEKNFYNADKMKFIGQLPSREILLGQLVGMLTTPIRKLMYILNEKGRKG